MNHTPSKLDADTCNMICPISAGMVGVCLTSIALIRVVTASRGIDTLGDDLLSLNALVFLIATLTSYFALRARNIKRSRRLEKFADGFFIAGMALMFAICLYITYAIGWV